MSKYLIVILLSVGLTLMINSYFIIKNSPGMLKRIWANIFLLIGFLFFFWGVSETMVKFIEYVFKLSATALTMTKFNPIKIGGAFVIRASCQRLLLFSIDKYRGEK